MNVREALLLKNVIGSGGISQEKIDEIAVEIGISIPSTPDAILAELDDIIENANEVTGEQSETLAESVQALIDGYGGSGAVQSNMIVIDSYLAEGSRFPTSITFKGDAVVGDYFLSAYQYNLNIPNTHIFSKLETITFEKKPSYIGGISAKAFNSSKIKTINVPWAVGEISNAPWGATGATINYNYVG